MTTASACFHGNEEEKKKTSGAFLPVFPPPDKRSWTGGNRTHEHMHNTLVVCNEPVVCVLNVMSILVIYEYIGNVSLHQYIL